MWVVPPVWASEPVVLTPATAVELAMVRNESLGMARSDANAARAHVREPRADGLPEVSARFDYTRNWLLPSILFNDTAVKIGSDNEIAGQLRLNQPLYTGGLVRGATQSARSRVTVANEAERQLRQAITAQVETALYDYLLATEIVRVRALALQRARSNQRQVGALREAVRVTRFEWTRAVVQFATAESDSIDSARDLALAGLNVKDVVGVDLSQEISVLAKFLETSALATGLASGNSVEDVIQQALKLLPECRQLQAQAEAYAGDERVAGAGTRPRLDLIAVGQMQFQDDAFTGVGDADEWRRSWSTGLMLQVPLFDGMRTRARVAKAREARRRIQLEAERLDRAIEREVFRAWMDVSAAGQRLQARQGSVEQSQLGLEDADVRYRTGAGTTAGGLGRSGDACVSRIRVCPGSPRSVGGSCGS